MVVVQEASKYLRAPVVCVEHHRWGRRARNTPHDKQDQEEEKEEEENEDDYYN